MGDLPQLWGRGIRRTSPLKELRILAGKFTHQVFVQSPAPGVFQGGCEEGG